MQTLSLLSLVLALALPSVSDTLEQNQAVLGPVKHQEAYPDLPAVEALHLPPGPPLQGREPFGPLSPGLVDPLLEEMRDLKVVDDDKPLSDAVPKALGADELAALTAAAEAAGDAAAAALPATASADERRLASRRAFLKTFVSGKYWFGDELQAAAKAPAPTWRLCAADPTWRALFTATEVGLPHFVRATPARSQGSLLPSPYPVIIAAAGRFHEAYYWDSYFGLRGVLDTLRHGEGGLERLVLAQGVVENFLTALQDYGHVPNGMRDYYLSRSQPPLLSSMVREVYTASVELQPERRAYLGRWLAERAFPLLERDYLRFWMVPGRRYDVATGLNHDWDALNLPRPERHSFDDEEALGETFRDVRAAAESGRDFTEAFRGRATHVADPQLNALLYKVESDLEWAATTLGRPATAERYRRARIRRRAAMNRYLWSGHRYESYDLGTRQRIPVLTADTFVPLFVGAASRQQAAAVRDQLRTLEAPGGLRASELVRSPDQWDGNNGWAPQQMMAWHGLADYGFVADARRLARKWVGTLASIYRCRGVIMERVDVATRDLPATDAYKYPPQGSEFGFFWTNGSAVDALTGILGLDLERIDGHPVKAAAGGCG